MAEKPMLESKVENYFKQQIKALGGLSYKFKSSVNGVPDQIAILDGHVHFVELKRPGQTPRAQQVSVQNDIRAQGVEVYNLSTIDEVNHFIKIVLKRTPQTPKTQTPKDITMSSADMFNVKEDT